jgi:hypothetical protein
MELEEIIENYLNTLQGQVDEWMTKFIDMTRFAVEYTEDWLDELEWEANGRK